MKASQQYHEHGDSKDASTNATLYHWILRLLLRRFIPFDPQCIVKIDHESVHKANELGQKHAKAPLAINGRGHFEGRISLVVAHAQRSLGIYAQQLEQNGRKGSGNYTDSR